MEAQGGPDAIVGLRDLLDKSKRQKEAAAIAGHRSSEIEEILGYPGRAALIHRDDMAL